MRKYSITAYVAPTGVTLVNADGAFAAILAPDDKPILSFEPPIGYEYPLEVGKTWTKSYRVTVHATKQTILLDATWKVGAYEPSLTVPAGTFKVFKISYSDTLGTGIVTWSSPEVRMWIKRVETRTAKHRAGPVLASSNWSRRTFRNSFPVAAPRSAGRNGNYPDLRIYLITAPPGCRAIWPCLFFGSKPLLVIAIDYNV